MVGIAGSSSACSGMITLSTTPCCAMYWPVNSDARDGEHGELCV